MKSKKECNNEEKKTETVCFMNLCMVQDGKGNVLALDKVNDSYTGTTFPGGHVEIGSNLFFAVLFGYTTFICKQSYIIDIAL